MKIGAFDTAGQVCVVAEIGNNHEGSFEVAKQMVRAAADCGVDAVKFQTFRTALFANPSDSARYERMQKFELSFREFSDLQELSHSLGLLFISTPLDLESARFLNGIVDAYKIASGDNDFYPLLSVVALTSKPIVMSSGASDLEQICRSESHIKHVWNQNGIAGQLAVLHCVSNYPTAPHNANLAAIATLADRLDCEVGYSDHTLGIEACALAVALGARVIEKHFTLDHHYSDFRDHQISAEPTEMRQLVADIRAASVLLGKPDKRVLSAEEEVAPLIRRSIVAANRLPVGHCITASDLLWLRPANGLPPGDEEKLLGKIVQEPIERAEPILFEKVA